MTVSVDRVARLVGGNDSGGGVSLPPLFAVLLMQALDTGSVTVADVLPWVRERLDHDRKRLQRNYGADDPFEMVTGDVLDQLTERRLLERHPDRPNAWVIGKEFVPGREVIVIPGVRGARKAARITVLSTADRAAHEAAKRQQAEVHSLAADMKPDGIGLRPLDPERVDALETRIREMGYHEDLPILVDQYGRILDGRHRRAAGRRLGIEVPKRLVKVRDDRHALAIAWDANESSPWTDSERRTMAKRLLAAGFGPASIGAVIGEAGARQRASVQLLIDPLVSDRKIAEEAETTAPTVGSERQRMEEAKEIRRTVLTVDRKSRVYVEDESPTANEPSPIATGVKPLHTSPVVTDNNNGESSDEVDDESEPEPDDKPEPGQTKTGTPRKRASAGQGTTGHIQWRIEKGSRNDVHYLHNLLLIGAGQSYGQVMTDIDAAEQLAEMMLKTIRRQRREAQP